MDKVFFLSTYSNIFYVICETLTLMLGHFSLYSKHEKCSSLNEETENYALHHIFIKCPENNLI